MRQVKDRNTNIIRTKVRLIGERSHSSIKCEVSFFVVSLFESSIRHFDHLRIIIEWAKVRRIYVLSIIYEKWVYVLSLFLRWWQIFLCWCLFLGRFPLLTLVPLSHQNNIKLFVWTSCIYIVFLLLISSHVFLSLLLHLIVYFYSCIYLDCHGRTYVLCTPLPNSITNDILMLLM